MKKLYFILICIFFLSSFFVHANKVPMTHIFIGFTWESLSQEQLQYVADNYDFVILGKSHANWNIEEQHETSKKLKQLNPEIKVFPYLNTAYRFSDQLHWPSDDFKEEWYYHINNERISVETPVRTKYWMNITNPELRAWLLDIMEDWFEKGDYDGIYFDAAFMMEWDNPNNELSQLDWTAIKKRNKALWDLLKEARLRFTGDERVLFNGIAKRDWILDRSLVLFEQGNIAHNEDFCFTAYTNPVIFSSEQEMIEDIELQLEWAKGPNAIIQKTNHRGVLTDEEKIRYSRYCFGSFLLGYVKDKTSFKFAYDYRPKFGTLQENALEINLDFGEPLSEYEAVGDVWIREFENSLIIVNMKEHNSDFIIPNKLVLMNGAESEKVHSEGEQIQIQSRDAVFLMKPIIGDANLDFKVTLEDLSEVTNNFGKNNKNSDLNEDNKVNIFDLVLVAKNIGK